MSTRIGKNYRVLIAPETTYGEAASGSFTELPDTIGFAKVVNTIARSAKTGTLKKQKYETNEGTTGATATLAGDFSPSHSIALDMAMFDTTSPRTIPASQPAAYSYTLYRVWTEDSKVDYVPGCVVDSFNVTGNSGEVVQYNLSMRGNDLIREGASGSIAGLTVSSCAPDITPFLFADVTADMLDSNITAINSFDLSIANGFQGDPEIYQNSSTKNLEILTSVDNTFNFSWNYDKDHDDEVYDHLVSSSLSDNTIALVATAGTFTIAINGKYNDYTLPDPDNGVFVSTAVVEILSDCDSSIEGLTITTT